VVSIRLEQLGLGQENSDYGEVAQSKFGAPCFHIHSEIMAQFVTERETNMENRFFVNSEESNPHARRAMHPQDSKMRH